MGDQVHIKQFKEKTLFSLSPIEEKWNLVIK
jgi:hypothetical protein